MNSVVVAGEESLSRIALGYALKHSADVYMNEGPGRASGDLDSDVSVFNFDLRSSSDCRQLFSGIDLSLDVLVLSLRKETRVTDEPFCESSLRSQLKHDFYLPLQIIKAALRKMRSQGAGKIILLVPLVPADDHCSLINNSAKCALIASCEALHYEMRAWNISLCAIPVRDSDDEWVNKFERALLSKKPVNYRLLARDF